ncbi:MAG TPA: hypothetical protein VFR81_13605 [Longimicrobium sp.]|jgi:hypothetical protein|nr:hypothetical protein [Longimicrobium sp.]
MASLNLDQIEVDSFETASEQEAVSVTVPRTNESPDCWSPLCIPTAVGPRCDTATNPI